MKLKNISIEKQVSNIVALECISSYVLGLYSSEKQEVSTPEGFEGFLPIIVTKDCAFHLLGKTNKRYKEILAESEDLQKRIDKNNLSLEKLRLSSSYYVVLGKKKEKHNIESFVLFGELNKLDFTSAIREWLEKYHPLLKNKQERLLDVLEKIDMEFDELVQNISKELVDYYVSNSKCEIKNKFYIFAKISYALSGLKKTLGYYKLEEFKREFIEEEYDKLIQQMTNEINTLEERKSEYCVILDFDDYVELTYFLNSPSHIEFAKFLSKIHHKVNHINNILDRAVFFANQRINQIVLEALDS